MATVLDFETLGARAVAPSFWVNHQAGEETLPALRGWLKHLGAVAEVMFADEIGPPESQRIRWVCAQTRDYAAAVGGKGAFAFRLGLGATTWLAPLMIARLPPLRRLAFVDRVRALERYEASPLGLSLFAVKVFLCAGWFEHPDVAREVGFDGLCMGRGA